MGMYAVGGGKGIGPAGKHQPSGHVVRQSPTMRPELLSAHPQGRWRSPGAAQTDVRETKQDPSGSTGRERVLGRSAWRWPGLPRSCLTLVRAERSQADLQVDRIENCRNLRENIGRLAHDCTYQMGAHHNFTSGPPECQSSDGVLMEFSLPPKSLLSGWLTEPEEGHGNRRNFQLRKGLAHCPRERFTLTLIGDRAREDGLATLW